MATKRKNNNEELLQCIKNDCDSESVIITDFLDRKISSDYCIDHKCTVYNCNNVIERRKVCIEHENTIYDIGHLKNNKCSIQECINIVLDKYDTCLEHTCHHTECNKWVVCYTEMKYLKPYKYCATHTCHNIDDNGDRCKYMTLPNKYVCLTHYNIIDID